jgi:hypothetical protein
MNKKIKFHKPNGSAFNENEEWIGVSKNKVKIISVEKFGDNKFDYEINYKQSDGSLSKKNAYNFQIRYQHLADFSI